MTVESDSILLASLVLVFGLFAWSWLLVRALLRGGGRSTVQVRLPFGVSFEARLRTAENVPDADTSDS